MIPYLHNAIFKVNNFLESLYPRSGSCDRSDPDVAIKAYSQAISIETEPWIMHFRKCIIHGSALR